MEFLNKAIAFLLTFIMTVIPYAGVKLPVIAPEEDNCKLNVSIISDVHIESKELFKKSFLKTALKRIDKASDVVDGIVVSGDLTNYADEESLALYYKYITELTDLPVVTAAGNHDIGHAGDRDVTDISRQQALANVVKYQNAYAGTQNTSNYYSTYVNGYKFIVIGDECVKDPENPDDEGGHWDAISMTQAQLDFLDRELADGAKYGKPVFVVSHWAIKGRTAEPEIWDDSGIDPNETEYGVTYNIPAILEKYNNVFYISGHMHAGVRSNAASEKFDMWNCETHNGVNYISMPSFGFLNRYGLFYSGTGGQLEVYDNKVVYRPVNYLTGNWYVNSEYTFDLVEPAPVLW